jgi:methylenetetrahydrofolate dehydrogenase (NADP+) / methenyltetrahydrofolate cyclohydrolase
MIVDGKGIAEGVYVRLRERVALLSRAPRLAIITCNPNFETKRYLALKEKKAHEIGVETVVQELGEEATTQNFIETILGAVETSDGIIVQLPLPKSIDVDAVLQSIPLAHDVDVLRTGNSMMLSPVVGAIKEILSVHNERVKDCLVTIIGSGRLVGLPSYHWFLGEGAHVSVVTRDTLELSHHTKGADIIVCGAGVPGLLTLDMVKEGVIVLDAGTSEEGGELRGDASPSCAERAKLFTPVPGGIGPLTIAMLLQNVVDCALRKGRVV